MIRFLQPWWLLALLPVFAIAAAYVWRQLRRRAHAVRFTNVDLARPSMDAKEPLERATVMLAIDVSLSMEADDVKPNRLAAAQEAAKEFVQQLPETFNLGLVSFAKSANVLVSPTKDHESVVQAIDGLQLAEATATGEAVFTCLQAIQTVPADGANGAPPARIVLLSDGYRTYGRSMEEAATAASSANVPVSTIAFGTDAGVVDIGGQLQRVPVDRLSLAQLAETTSGFFYEAASASELQRVYEDMGSSIGHRIKPREITQWYAGAALLLALAAGAMSLLWTSRLP
jgi:Ca-activated chloride channel homolog